MSEYQYYEFRCVDRSLSSKEQKEIAELSSRAEVNSSTASFVYSYSDFPGDTEELMLEYFDMMLYMANWGSREVMFRLPREFVDTEQTEQYCAVEEIEQSIVEDFVLIKISFHEEDQGSWIDGEGWLERMLDIRQELLQGDLRVLYLAWLKATGEIVEYESPEDDILEPPVPAGLGEFSPALEAFVEFVDLDTELIEVAAKNSEKQKKEEPQRLERWIDQMPEAEQRDFLLRLSRGEAHLSAIFNKRLRAYAPQSEQPKQPTQKRRTISEIVKAAEIWREEKQERERQEKRQARIRELDALAAKEKKAWEEVDAWIEEKKSASYDKAVALLLDLRDLAAHRGDPKSFQDRLAVILQTYPTRSALLRRIHEAKL